MVQKLVEAGVERNRLKEPTIMEAWIIQTGDVISPFGEPPREAQFATETIGQAVDGALIRRGLSINLRRGEEQIDGSTTDVLVLADHC